MDISSNKQFIDLAEWLEAEVGRDFLDDPRKAHHPYAQAWCICQKGINNYEASKDEAIPRVSGLIRALSKLSPFPTRDKTGVIRQDNGFVNQLLQRSQQSIADFDSVELEAMVAWAFSGLPEQSMMALDPSDRPTPDFEITFRGQPVFIECKARTTATPQHQQIETCREEIICRVRPLIEQAPVNYGILLSTLKIPKRSEIARLLKTLNPLLASGVPFSYTFGDFKIEGTILLSPDEDVITAELQPLGPCAHVPEPVRSFMVTNGVGDSRTYAGVDYQCQLRVNEGKICCRNPRVIVVHIAVTPDHTKATARFIKDARRQLSTDAQGIVMVRAPDFYGQDQFARLGQAIKSELSSTKRVNGVVLFHQAIIREDIKPHGIKSKLWWQVLWIPNKNAKYPLPDDFIYDRLSGKEGFQILNRVVQHQ